jgi:outer membrane protein assembly factor BamB
MVWLISSAVAAEDDGASSSAGLHRPIDRKLTQQVEAAKGFLSRGEIAQGLPLLEILWRQHGDQLVGDESSLRSVKDRLLEMLRQLPDKEQSRFWKRMEAAHPDPMDPVYLGAPTRAGLAALVRRAAAFRDRGEAALSAATFALAARHPAATAHEALLAQVQQLDQLALIQGPSPLQEWLDAAAPQVRQTSLTVGGQSTTVESWLRRHLAETDEGAVNAVAHDRPALAPLWRRPAEISQDLRTGLEQSAEWLRMQGIARLPSTRPVVVGSRIVIGTPGGLDCLDAASGRLLWTTANRSGHDRATLAMQQQNPIFRQNLLSMLSQQFQTNTLLGALSHDGDTVYQVVESHRLTDPFKPAMGDALEAYDLATGERKWRIGGVTPGGDPTHRFLAWGAHRRTSSDKVGDLFVCGPPLAIGNRLHLLCEQAGELLFVTFDRQTLEVVWASAIGDLLPNQGGTLPRSYCACPLIWTGELIIASTNCGAIFAVDPAQERLKWVTRVPVEVWSQPRPDIAAADVAAESALHSWRGASLHLAGDRIVCIPPESQGAYLVETATGRIVGTIPRGDGLACLGVAENLVVILEPTAVRAHDAATGKQVWRTVVGEVRGRGLVTATSCVQPLDAGSVAVIDLTTGRRRSGAVHSEVVWGNLAAVPDGWVSGDEFGVQKFPDLADRLARSSFGDDLDRARHDLEAGDFAAARRRMSPRDDAAARRVLRDADLAEITFDPERSEELREELLQRSPSREEKGEALAALAEAALRQHRFDAVVRDSLDGIELGLMGERRVGDDATRRVRWDRYFQGLIIAAFEKATPSERHEMERLLAERWRAADESGDPFALQQRHQHWRALPWARRRFLDATDRVFLGTSLLTRELVLVEAMEGSPGDEAAWALRREWQDAGFPDAAADIDRMLLAHWPGRITPKGRSTRQLLESTGVDVDRLNRRITNGPVDAWPLTMPRVAESKDFYEDAYQVPLAVEAEADGIWDRIDVTVDRQGRTLRFSGGGASGAWTVTLPRSPSSLQQSPLTYRAWGWGQLLIVRIGTQLLAVTPFDEQGLPAAHVVWSLDLLGSAHAAPQALVVERVLNPWKQGAETYRILDQFHRDLGLVGPVRPGYLCFLQQGRLMAVETQTGRQLWERWDIPPGAILLGDDDHVLVWRPDRQMVEVLASADGRTIRQQRFAAGRSDVWRQAGGKVWAGRVDSELTIVCRDLVADRIVWQRVFPKESLPLSLDSRTIAVADPRGVLHVIDAESGVTLDEPLTVDFPRPVERVMVSRDEARWYVAFSGPVDRSFDWQAAQPLQGYRRPLLNGPLWAIDRSARRIVWKREIETSPWMLDQNRTAPVLTQIYKLPPPNGGQGIGEGVFRLIDKRTGRDVFLHRDINLLANFALEPNAELGQFEIRTERTAFQFDYAPPAAE